MFDDMLTLLWRSLTTHTMETANDEVILLVDGYFLVVDECEFDALGDTVEDAEAELRRIAATEDLSCWWDYHFLRGTALLETVKSLAESW